MDFNSDTLKQEHNTDKIGPSNTAWLIDLGIQSWQAELVMSGLIVTGLFQMPDLFINWAETSIIQSGELEQKFLFFASAFFLIGIDCLVLFFGIHLLFRGIWIALLGLNSVYPDGIDAQSTNGMGQKYWQKAKEKYPDLTQYCVELDANCSLLFSLATVTIIVVSSLSIFILAIYQFVRFLTAYFPAIANHVLPIGIGVYASFLVVSLVVQYLGKKYPDNPTVEKFITGYGTVTGVAFSLYIFQKPIGYITSIWTSNEKSKNNRYFFLVACGVFGYFGGGQLGKSDAFYDFRADKYVTFNNKPHQILALNYENLMGKEAQIYTPVIQSDVITEDFLKIFIPTIAREKERMNLKDYSIWDRIRMKNAEKEAIDKDKFEAYKQFNRIYINDVEQLNLDYQFYTHPQAEEKGLLVYVASEKFVKGRNILEIRKNYFSEDSIQKIVKIPFFFDKKEEK